jgi:hypothetical protein
VTARNLCVPVAVAVLVAGCAGNTDLPLIFGTSNTIGISIGGSVAEQGGDFTIGYKGQDFALVPVSVHQPDGTEKRIGMDAGAGDDKFGDAFSVLGQFSASAARSEKSAPKASLGKFFATGLAAKTLSEGFAKKLGKDRTAVTECSPRAPVKTVDEVPFLDGLKKVSAQQQVPRKDQQALQYAQSQLQPQDRPQASAAPRPSGLPAAEVRRGGALMFFGQYTALAFSLGGGAPQQGMDFILGWKDRNLAIVPVIERGADGNANPIQSQAGNQRDALSVLGQFEFDTREDAGTVEAGLGKFFATGGAARQLSDGFRVRLCEEYVPVSPRQAKSDGPSTGGATQ